MISVTAVNVNTDRIRRMIIVHTAAILCVKFCVLRVMGICPTIFGPYFWNVIHMSALSAGKEVPPEKAGSYIQFFQSMADILPCAQCGKHLRENLLILPPDMSDLFRWSVDIHNLVNSQLSKSEISYEKALRYWSARCTRTSDKDRMLMMIGVFVLLVALFLMFKKS